MAKKRKKRSRKTKTARVKTVNKKKSSIMKVAYLLAFIGGIITIVSSVIGFLFAIGITFLTFFLAAIFAKAIIFLAVMGAVCGILMLYAANNLKKRPKKSAILLLIVSIVAFLVVGAIGIGGILGIIAAVLVLAETSK